jgi:hypothetical protein
MVALGHRWVDARLPFDRCGRCRLKSMRIASLDAIHPANLPEGHRPCPAVSWKSAISKGFCHLDRAGE